MEIKIGVQHAPREIVVETDLDGDAIAAQVRDASEILELTDTKGRRVLVPVAKIAYVEIGSPTTGTVGFRS